jgi:lipid-A-disaccharide synthase
MIKGSSKKTLFLFAGEVSGDMHGAMLLNALKRDYPDINLMGVAGPQMRAQGVVGTWKMEDFNVMGFSDVFRSLPQLWHKFSQIKECILETQPDAVIFIDSSAFSLRMAKALRKKGFPGKLVQYICPAVWAWGKSRITQIGAYFDLLLCIYPFETACFPPSRLRVEYVGNPVKEIIEKHVYDPYGLTLFGIENNQNLIGLFPGSRSGEIKRNLPLLLEAARDIQKCHPEAIFAISCVTNTMDIENPMSLVYSILEKSSLDPEEVHLIPKSYTYELMKSCRSAIAKSGTVTLELALHGCPTVVMYELSRINQWIAKYIFKIKLPCYSIPNILCGKKVFPECIQHGIVAKDLSQQLISLYKEGPTRNRCLKEMQKLQQILLANSASKSAAKNIGELLL